MKSAMTFFLSVGLAIPQVSFGAPLRLPSQLPLDANLGTVSAISTDQLPHVPAIPTSVLVSSYESIPASNISDYEFRQNVAAQAAAPPVEITNHLNSQGCAANDCGRPGGLPDYGPSVPEMDSSGGFSSPSSGGSTVIVGGGYSPNSPSSGGGSAASAARSEYERARSDYESARSDLSSAADDYNSKLSEYNSAKSSLEQTLSEVRNAAASLNSAIDARNTSMNDRNSAAQDHNSAAIDLHNAQVENSRLIADIQKQKNEQQSLEEKIKSLDQSIVNGSQSGATKCSAAVDKVQASAAQRSASAKQANDAVEGHNSAAVAVNDSTRLQEGLETIRPFLQESNTPVPDVGADSEPGSLAMSPNDPGYVEPISGNGGLPAGISSNPVEHADVQCGSIVHTDSLTLGESIPIAGTPFRIYYFSDRVVGRRGDYQLHVPLHDGSAVRTSLTLQIGGRERTQSFDPPQRTFDFAWDGLDQSGIQVIGKLLAKVTLTQYDENAEGKTHSWTTYLGNYRPQHLGLGGWSLGIVHFYSVAEQRLYMGDGQTRGVIGATLNHGSYSIPAADGSEVYVFDGHGKHSFTRHGLTGAMLYSFSYDGQGRLTEIVDGYRNSTRIERTADSLRLKAPFGQITTFSMDETGYLSAVLNPNGETYEMRYLEGGLLKEFKKPQGQISEFRYDSLGYLVADNGAGGSLLSFLGSINSDSNAMGLQMRTAEGRITTYTLTRGSDGMYRRVQRKANGETSMVEFKSSEFERTISPMGRVETSYGQDARFGGLVNLSQLSTMSLVELPNMQITTERRQQVETDVPSDPFGFKVLETSVTTNGKTTLIRYSQATRESVTFSPLGRKTTVTTDAWGKPVRVQSGTLLPVVFTYDGSGRPISVVRGQRRIEYRYNSDGYVDKLIDPLGHETSFRYDNAGRIISQVLPNNRKVEFRYDANGMMTSITPPGRPSHFFQYNLSETMSSYSAPLLGGKNRPTETTYSYNKDNQLTAVQKPDGQTIRLNYGQGDERLQSIAAARGDYTFTYLDDGRLQTLTSPDQAGLKFTYYGNLPRTVESSIPGGGSTLLTYGYNSDLQLGSIELNGSSVKYDYDQDGSPVRVGDMILRFDSQSGLLAATQLENLSETYERDSLFGELKGWSSNFQKHSLMSESFERDSLGRVTERTEVSSGRKTVFRYEYDSAGRLASVHQNGKLVASYQYDENGNRLLRKTLRQSREGEYDDQDRLTSYGKWKYFYSANGALTHKIDLSSGLTTKFHYDSNGNLLAVDGTGVNRLEYIIDGLNRRVAKKVSGRISEQYVYQSQLQIAGVLDGDGNLVSQFVFGSKPNVPDYMIRKGVMYKIVSDHIGNVRMVVEAKTGKIVQQMDYDEFGGVIRDTQPGFQPFGFAGGLYDRDTKLVRFGVRDYDPETGRWSSKDPILFRGGDTNLYAYVMSDPVNFIDPLGLWSFYIGIGAGHNIENSPGSGYGSTTSRFTGFGYDSSRGGFSFNTTGTGTSTTGLFGGGGLGFGFFSGSLDQFMGEGSSSNVGLGVGLAGGAASYFTSDSGGIGLQLDFFGPGLGAGRGQQRTCTREGFEFN